MKYEFYGIYSDDSKKSFISAQENDLKLICSYLKTDFDVVKDIVFKVFDTREGKQASDPNHSISRASARFDEMAIYRFWTSDDDPHFPHEITHLVAHTWASPYVFFTELDTAYGTKIEKKIEMVSTSFMQEGLAIAVDDLVFKRPLLEKGEHKLIDEWCRINKEKLPIPLTHVANFEGFGNYANELVIPFTASFSKYLLVKYGLKKYKEMYIALKETLEAKENVEIIEGIYTESEENLLNGWVLSLP